MVTRYLMGKVSDQRNFGGILDGNRDGRGAWVEVERDVLERVLSS